MPLNSSGTHAKSDQAQEPGRQKHTPGCGHCDEQSTVRPSSKGIPEKARRPRISNEKSLSELKEWLADDDDWDEARNLSEGWEDDEDEWQGARKRQA